MSIDLLQFVDMNCLLRGTVNKGKADEMIFQNCHFGQQKYPGPKIPANPRAQNQQLQRLQFKRSILIADSLPEEIKQHLSCCIPADKTGLTWRTFFISSFIKRRKYGQGIYGIGIYSSENPPQKVRRYGNIAFGDGFYSRTNSLPRARQYNSDVYGSGSLLT